MGFGTIPRRWQPYVQELERQLAEAQCAVVEAAARNLALHDLARDAVRALDRLVKLNFDHPAPGISDCQCSLARGVREVAPLLATESAQVLLKEEVQHE